MKYAKLVSLLVGIGTFVLILSFNKISKKPVETKKQVKSYKTNLSQEKWVDEQLKKLTLEEKIGQSFMIACWTNKSEEHILETKELITKNKIGGVIFFQGEKENLLNAQASFNGSTTIPLLYGIDGEWGAAMRIYGEKRYPYAQTIGAANDPELTKELSRYMAIELSQLGIHLNFAPVADINSNYKNPVIGFRSFGSNKELVGKHVQAFVEGHENEQVLSCIKHFPGHGDTDKDSHLELPSVSKSEVEFKDNEFYPFQKGILANTSAVMIAHLNVPKLDPSGTPSSLSKKVIQDYLRKDLNFKGLVVSDALNMKAVADKYGKSEVVLKAYMAGCDVLLYPESIEDAIDLIVKKVKSGDLERKTVDERCANVLRAKYKAIVSKPMIKRKPIENERDYAFQKTYEKALTLIKNEGNVLPINQIDRKIVRISIGTHASYFRDRVDLYAPIEHHHYFTIQEAKERLKKLKFKDEVTYLLDFHSNSQRAGDNYGFENWKEITELVPEKANLIVSFFGNPLVLMNEMDLPMNVDACLLAYENHKYSQEAAAQAIFGAFSVSGKLQIGINDKWNQGFGLSLKGNGRLKYTVPEELNVSRTKLAEIDQIVEKAIEAKALPGCQVVVAIDGKVIHRKAYGTTMYEKGDSVTLDHIYDLASVTKIAASTVSLMKLTSENKFDVNDDLGTLVPNLVEGTPYSKLKASDLLTHQAGLTAWVPFYKNTRKDGKLVSEIYSTEMKEGFKTPVAEGIWIKDDYWKTMIETIVKTPLNPRGKYEYSDLSYYFFMRYIESKTGKTIDKYTNDEIYSVLGLQSMTYQPLNKFKKKMVVPTEDDKDFRGQVIHGYVHDPGAAMMGGVAGHAGLFSTATDLASLMEVLLNDGQIGSYSLISKNVVKKWTSCQYCPGNRRGLGFDKPIVGSSKGPTYEGVSPETFGHTGFTGTCAWADPVNKVNFVFVSNRVYPNAENKKITSMSVRTEIQRVIYEALRESKSESGK